MNSHAIPLLLALAAASAQAAPLLTYRVTSVVPDYDSEVCGCEYTVSEINNQGVMAGGFSVFDGFGGTYTVDESGLHPIRGTGNGFVHHVVDLNDRGEVLVNGEVSRNDIIHSYLYRGDGRPAIDISIEALDYSRDGGLNNRGHAIGVAGSGRDRAFYYDGTQSRYLELGLPTGSRIGDLLLNDAETVAGYAFSLGAFKYEDGRLSLLEGMADAHAINDAGQILGATFTGQSAIRNADGSLQLLDFRASENLNGLGWTVGWAGVGAARHGFLYRDGRSYDLNSLLVASDAAQWVLSEGLDVNDKGQIVGTGLFNGKAMPFLATPVPEPGSYALMLCGLGVIGWATRQRRRRAPAA
ncbi:PEP-CTERM sorting domain-containing protein [uncultured Azohydromonas sp.]|jgi:PEP-CTERM putative exosortase interaction domain|uniref:PEP-CTERM sorting domain-containing protein n=1 Tax=uncultured Azohydromonas sp. TaxID=487342 RepID=UPI00260FFE51|nr:PEP-CTERM sorting domain-containing protein [uncultured Azohydromonas sp.]